VDFPTHLKVNILDLVITKVPERMTEVTQAGRLGKRDHVMALTKGNISPSAHAGGVASPQLAQAAIKHTKRESRVHLKEKVHHLVSTYVP
jgi:hypothetical protein